MFDSAVMVFSIESPGKGRSVSTGGNSSDGIGDSTDNCFGATLGLIDATLCASEACWGSKFRSAGFSVEAIRPTGIAPCAFESSEAGICEYPARTLVAMLDSEFRVEAARSVSLKTLGPGQEFCVVAAQVTSED
jgi:hypothetical protein